MEEKNNFNEKSVREGKHNRMGTEPILPLIVKMSLPSMFSMLVQACYNIVDSIYVSRLGGYALSAVSLIYPIQMLNVAVGVGTSVGLSSLISRKLGEKDYDEAQSAANHGVFLAGCSWVLFAVFGLSGTQAFCSAFSENPELINPAVDYCTIVCTGSLFALVSSQLEKVMQACGNMMAPMWCMLTGAITNIILDPIMIFGYFNFPAMGVAGAALATVIGQLASMFVTILFIQTSELPIRFKMNGFKPKLSTIKNIYQVALPSMLMQSIGSVLNVCMNAILIGFSETAVAVLGVYYKLNSFVFMPVFGMNHGLLPIMGYNYGAKNQRRLITAYKDGIIIAILIMSIGTMLFIFAPDFLLSFFNAKGELLTIGRAALKTISLSFPVAAYCIITGTFFQATGHGVYSLVISVLRQLGIILPVAWIFSKLFGLTGIWYSYPIAEFFSLALSIYLFKKLWKKEISKL